MSDGWTLAPPIPPDRLVDVMNLSELVHPDAVFASFKASSAKQVLQELGRRAADVYGLNCREVTEGLMARERLGSTAMGSGVAIPHARVSGTNRIVGMLMRLEKPVDLEAPDGQGVDLIMALLAPTEAGADHLRALARVSRLLRDHEMREKLRAAEDPAALHALLMDVSASRAA